MTTRDKTPHDVEYPCPKCRAGVLQPHELTYFTTVDGQMLVVPNFPAWVCDICGYVEYDERALGWLYTLLSPPMQHRPRRHATHSTRPRPEK
ncbi:MAG TPA: YgiT-type zinc finger protein [Chloroflexi bacterium]|nr:YgiT-type zinc finger protein [Chloroflexota bacterium]